jgi:hypothetical protein
MSTVKVYVEVSDQNVKDILWLVFNRTEFADESSTSQALLRKLDVIGALDEKIADLDAGLAHCFFVAQNEEDGESTLEQYLAQMEPSAV